MKRNRKWVSDLLNILMGKLHFFPCKKSPVKDMCIHLKLVRLEVGYWCFKWLSTRYDQMKSMMKMEYVGNSSFQTVFPSLLMWSYSIWSYFPFFVCHFWNFVAKTLCFETQLWFGVWILDTEKAFQVSCCKKGWIL